MKKAITIISLFTFLISFSQIDEKVINGKILDRSGIIPGVHIVNTITNQATYSNENGEFKIQVRRNDMLRLSCIGYKTKFIIIKKENLQLQQNIFIIEKTIYTLEEIKIRTNRLLGSLVIDTKEIPIYLKNKSLMETMDFSDIDFNGNALNEQSDQNTYPNPVTSDPTTLFKGLGTSINMPFNRSKKLWELRKELAFKKGIPAKLMKELGPKFFFIELGIPPEKYYRFLDFCNHSEIENLYKEGRKLNVINVLQKESKMYLKTLNEKE